MSTHVVHSKKGGWDVKASGVEEPLNHFLYKKDAEAWARREAIREQTELFIHGRDGKIQRKNSYGGDSKYARG